MLRMTLREFNDLFVEAFMFEPSDDITLQRANQYIQNYCSQLRDDGILCTGEAQFIEKDGRLSITFTLIFDDESSQSWFILKYGR